MIKDDELRDMKKSVETLADELRNGKFAEEIYDVGKIWNGIKRELDEPTERDKIAERMLEMKEYDKILKLKSEEMKAVRLERMRVAKESTLSLEELSKSDTSEAIQNNSEQFLRLLQNEIRDFSGENVDVIKTVKPTRRYKIKVEEPDRKSQTFIERNIKLAKCGDGILSLTDEEKLRLKIVLEDIDSNYDNETQLHEMFAPASNEYVLNDESKKTLEEIDKRLEEHEKTKFLLRSIRSSELPKETPHTEELVREEIRPKIYTSSKNELKILKEVDKLLCNLNSSTAEVIDPLLDEELQYLIEESKQSISLSACTDQNDLVNVEAPNTFDCHIPSKETISELVNTAKNNMPNFKFRCE